MALIAAVLEQSAPSPRKLRPSVPHGLDKVVMRCLEKQPGERFKSYRELRQTLSPYGSTAPTPATLGLRLLAGMIDSALLSFVITALIVPFFGNPLKLLNVMYQQPTKALGWMLLGLTLSILYYALLEGVRGASLGKLLCGLRVAGPDRNPPGVLKAALRALIYVVTPIAPYWLAYGANPKAFFTGAMATQYVMSFSFYIMAGLLFSTVRRRNGFAAVHDLATHTRVLSRVALQARPALGVREATPAGLTTAPAIGPYHVLETLERTAEAEWLLGYDLRLLRKVWIRKVSADTPPVAPVLRNLGRVGRLRWLAARRSPEESWDAFEAPAGRPLLHLAREPQPWSRVRFWLYDLARELSAAQIDGTLPAVLGLERVWITDEGRAKLLDFPAPGIGQSAAPNPRPETTPATGRQTAQQFLDQVAAVSLAGRPEWSLPAAQVPVPLPVHARSFLQTLPRYPDAAALAGALQALLNRLAEVTRGRRAAVVGGCLLVPLLVGPGMLVGSKILRELNQSSPGLIELNTLLRIREPAPFFGVTNRNRPTDRQFSIYIAHHYRATITHDASWSTPLTLGLLKGKARKFAEQSVAEYPAPTEAEIAEADAAVEKVMPKGMTFGATLPPWLPAAAMAGALVIYVCFPALVAALLFRGGLVLLIARVTFVRKDGVRASRLRAFWRALVAWSALAVGGAVFGAVLAMLQGRAGVLTASIAAGFAVCGLTILSLALPKRGLQDRLAGTWPVPR